MLFFFLLFFCNSYTEPVSCGMPSRQSTEGWTGGEEGARLGVAPLQLTWCSSKTVHRWDPRRLGPELPTLPKAPQVFHKREESVEPAAAPSLLWARRDVYCICQYWLQPGWNNPALSSILRQLQRVRVCAHVYTHALSCTHLNLVETTGGA